MNMYCVTGSNDDDEKYEVVKDGVVQRYLLFIISFYL